ncbi:hypothetical protein Thiosp_00916 [Thiorhodovibrio litoralis]|nr:hypothetical protein [Thiorhodovibrio winogradskyi]WPL11188.1 hypothetical protein Thiosp_00916 [Thiorhodovibrio litoralis]
MTAMTDTTLRVKGVQALIDALGEVDAEKFIALMAREPFDYTEWQRQLWPEKSVEELSQAAMARRARVLTTDR